MILRINQMGMILSLYLKILHFQHLLSVPEVSKDLENIAQRSWRIRAIWFLGCCMGPACCVQTLFVLCLMALLVSSITLEGGHIAYIFQREIRKGNMFF